MVVLGPFCMAHSLVVVRKKLRAAHAGDRTRIGGRHSLKSGPTHCQRPWPAVRRIGRSIRRTRPRQRQSRPTMNSCKRSEDEGPRENAKISGAVWFGRRGRYLPATRDMFEPTVVYMGSAVEIVKSGAPCGRQWGRRRERPSRASKVMH
jgi:hypothetical protein